MARSIYLLVGTGVTLHIEYKGRKMYEIWIVEQTHHQEVARASFSGEFLKKLLEDRIAIAHGEVNLLRDGRDVLIDVKGEEFGRIYSETLRDGIKRATHCGIANGVK